jgi:hypothetical protein
MSRTRGCVFSSRVLIGLIGREINPPFFSDQLLFVYRWLLLECKREFAFNESLHVLEIMWSTLKHHEIQNSLQLGLYEEDINAEAVEIESRRSSLSSSDSTVHPSTSMEIKHVVDTRQNCKACTKYCKKKDNTKNKNPKVKSTGNVIDRADCDDDDDQMADMSSENDDEDDDDDKRDNTVQQTLVPETAKKLLQSLQSRSYSDTVLNIDQAKEQEQQRSKLKSLFERSTSDSNLNSNFSKSKNCQCVSPAVKHKRNSTILTCSSMATSSFSCSMSLFNSYSGNSSYDKQSPSDHKNPNPAKHMCRSQPNPNLQHNPQHCLAKKNTDSGMHISSQSIYPKID